TVVDMANKEINTYTELDVRYNEEKQGRKIVGFDLIWSSGQKIRSATKKQIKELKAITDLIFNDMYEFMNLNDLDNHKIAIDIIIESERLKIYIFSESI